LRPLVNASLRCGHRVAFIVLVLLVVDVLVLGLT
jgi:hypothetical protein